MEFIRFGGLSSVKQKGYDPSMPGLHSPPARRGIYAFPLGCVEPFLLGGDRLTAKGKARYVKDKQGRKIEWDNENDLSSNKEARPFYFANGEPYYPDRNFYKVFATKKTKDGKLYWARPAPMKRFSYTGEIWHHLTDRLKPHQIISRNGGWILSTMNDYLLAFNKESINLRAKSAASMGKDFDINSVRGKFGWYALDHIEVFIEKIK
jgi:hypothetical protein